MKEKLKQKEIRDVKRALKIAKKHNFEDRIEALESKLKKLTPVTAPDTPSA